VGLESTGFMGGGSGDIKLTKHGNIFAQRNGMYQIANQIVRVKVHI
jgi:hypothetical protein